MKNNMIITIVITALVVGAGGFLGGMKYQQSQSPAGRFGNFQGNRNGQFPQRGQGLRPVNGEILNQDDKSITIKLQDGSSKIIFLSNSTVINKASTGSKEDLKKGEQVAAFGTENSDGSITAQTIAIGGGLFRGMGRSNPSGGPTISQ